MPTLKLNGINIHTQVLGDEGPLIFMCHGLVSGSIASWYFQFAPALAKRHRVVLYDLRGHGKSEQTTTGFDLATMAQDLAALVAYYQSEFGLENEQVSLVGHSYGALVALQYAAMHGPQIRSMVVVDAPMPAADYIYPGMRTITTPEHVESLAGDLMVHLNIQGSRRRQKFIEHLQYLYLGCSLKRDIAESGNIDEAMLATLSMPVLLIYGEQSDCLVAGKKLSKLMSNSRYKTLPCGHYIPMEAPDLLEEELNNFFVTTQHLANP